MHISKNLILNIGIIIGIIAAMIVMARYDWNGVNQYEAYNTDTLSYVKAKVLSVESENLEKDSVDNTRYLGTQDLKVKILEGDSKGNEVDVVNNLSRTQNVKVVQNQSIILCVDKPESGDIYYSVYNYYRYPVILGVVVIFCVIVIVIGGKKGIRAVAGLAFTVYIILIYMLQAVYHGQSAMLVTVVTATLVGVVSLWLLNGFEKKTAAAVLSTGGGLICTGCIFMIFAKLLHISGYNLDEAEALVLVNQSTGLNLRTLFFASVIISSLGAVMDVAMSISSALYEILAVNGELHMKDVMKSGINIGRDMIGTMCNTLILAYTGSALSTMLLLIAYGYQPQQLLNSDYLSMEVLQGIASTLGVVLTVPIASAVAAFIYRSHKKEKGEYNLAR